VTDIVCSCDCHVISLPPAYSYSCSSMKSQWHRTWMTSDATSLSTKCSLAQNSSSKLQRHPFETCGSPSQMTSSKRQTPKLPTCCHGNEAVPCQANTPQGALVLLSAQLSGRIVRYPRLGVYVGPIPALAFESPPLPPLRNMYVCMI